MIYFIQIDKIINNPMFILVGTIIIIWILVASKNLKFKRGIIITLFKSIRIVGYFIIIVTSLLLIRNLINAPYEESSKQLLSTFGLLAVLSSLCFSLSNHLEANQKSITLYAGKRFLLAALLLVFCILLTYISSHSHIVGFNLFITTFRNIVAIITNALIVIVGFTFSYLSLEGYTILYNYLWESFEFKIKKVPPPEKQSE